METQNFQITQPNAGTMSKTFMSGVFSWMFLALLVTTVVAYLFATELSLLSLLVGETGLTPLGYIVMFAPIGFVMLMSFGFQRLSYPVLLALFLVYSAVTGASLCFIFLVYTASSIFTTFLSASLMFGVMAVGGYVTKKDLTGFGSIMMMGLFGIIIASLVNLFLKSDSMGYIISFIGVMVFTGLTAYDVQKLKNIGAGVDAQGETGKKLAILGALNLYLDFINLFLMLLRLFGRKK